MTSNQDTPPSSVIVGGAENTYDVDQGDGGALGAHIDLTRFDRDEPSPDSFDEDLPGDFVSGGNIEGPKPKEKAPVSDQSAQTKIEAPVSELVSESEVESASPKAKKRKKHTSSSKRPSVPLHSDLSGSGESFGAGSGSWKAKRAKVKAEGKEDKQAVEMEDETKNKLEKRRRMQGIDALSRIHFLRPHIISTSLHMWSG